jgi:aminoglycoside 6'-N-acetyltransferase I
MMVIRAVTAADAQDWLRLRRCLWPDADPEEHREEVERYFAGERREPAEVLLALDDHGAPVGLAELSIRNIVDGCTTDRVVYLEGWYVRASARHCGVGRALIRAAEDWAIRQGCSEFGSDTAIDNDLGRAAHLGLGFEETGRVRTFRKTIGGADRKPT